jgi:hypothetical protein
MAMDPKLRSSLGDEPPHIRGEGWVESVPFEGCRNGLRTGRMGSSPGLNLSVFRVSF